MSLQSHAAGGIRRHLLPLLGAALVAALSLPAAAGVISPGARFVGKASWYGPGFHGRRMADGAPFDQESNSAAHRTLPFGSRLLCHNSDNGRFAVIRIQDRGPFIPGRTFDVSRGTARELGFLEAGLARLECRML